MASIVDISWFEKRAEQLRQIALLDKLKVIDRVLLGKSPVLFYGSKRK